MVAHILWRAREGLTLIVIQQPAERLGQGAPTEGGPSSRQTWYLKQHSADEVRGLEQLQVDVHVERHLPPALQLLLLGRLVLVPAHCCSNVTLQLADKQVLTKLGSTCSWTCPVPAAP